MEYNKQEMVRAIFLSGVCQLLSDNHQQELERKLDVEILESLAMAPLNKFESAGVTDGVMLEVIGDLLCDLFPEAVISQN